MDDHDLQAQLDAARGQLAALGAAQEELLRAVSHDLRAPLRHVISYAGLLREVLQELPEPPGQVREALGFAATMEQSARRMGLMIDGLQAISRAARAPLALAAVDVRAAIEQVRATLADAAALRWDLPQAMPAVRADAALLALLLAQVLGNAVKFSRASPRPEVRVEAQDQGERVRLAITDNGAGFDPAHAGSLFGVFQRLHREREFDGVGAGLALCKTIAERHGARIAAASAGPGRGCTVTLDWPAG